MTAKPKPPRNNVANGKLPNWRNEAIVCIATGPSLTAEQIDAVHTARIYDRCKVIAINEAALPQYKPLAAPWADMLYAADRTWWQHYRPEFYGYRISGEPVEGVKTTPLKCLQRNEPMSRDPEQVVSGGHSGFQALGLALALGASKVILLGYDCGGPKRNAHMNRPDHFKRDVNMAQWITVYNRVPKEWPGVPVYNCSPISRITAFPKVPLEDVL